MPAARGGQCRSYVQICMAQPYLDQLRELVSSIDGGRNLVCRHFFSGAALYARQRICASLSPKGLAIKLPEARCNELISQGKAIPLRYFDRSPIKRGYALIPDFRSFDDAEIRSYFEESIEHAISK